VTVVARPAGAGAAWSGPAAVLQGTAARAGTGGGGSAVDRLGAGARAARGRPGPVARASAPAPARAAERFGGGRRGRFARADDDDGPARPYAALGPADPRGPGPFLGRLVDLRA
jgi:hypothetical protein